MGDNFLKQQAKNFRKRRDLTSNVLKLPALFARPDALKQVFDAPPCREETYTIGETLLAMPGTRHNRVEIVRDHRAVGFVGGEGAEVLLGALPAPGSPGVLPMHVTKVRQLSGVAQLELVEDVGNE